jgi:hypothetical protein
LPTVTLVQQFSHSPISAAVPRFILPYHERLSHPDPGRHAVGRPGTGPVAARHQRCDFTDLSAALNGMAPASRGTSPCSGSPRTACAGLGAITKS